MNGEIVYKIYRALTYGLTPLVRLHLRWRRFRSREHPTRWRERLGCASSRRPNGHLIWFHAVSLGEGLAAIPVIKCCLERSPDVIVLMTTTTTSAFEVIKKRLPSNVIYQFAPLDIPCSIDGFLQYWRPSAIILIESELWPNLIMGATRLGITLILINGRMSTKSFHNWSHPLVLPLITLMLSKFSLILPLSTSQGILFQLLQAPPFIINYAGDLKYAIQNFDITDGYIKSVSELCNQFSHRKVWMASSIHKDEVEIFTRAHNLLKRKYDDIVTILVPRKPKYALDIDMKLSEEGVNVALRSRGDHVTCEKSIYVVDTLGELRYFYHLIPIAVIGGSFTLGSAGHNISEAAAAGCAVLTGHHVGHFSHMVAGMQRINPLSVQQVSGDKLVEVVSELFDDVTVLEARRVAAKKAYDALSSGVIERIWQMMLFHIFESSNNVAELLSPDQIDMVHSQEES